jgi:AcrR family transcriptional regulator
MRDIASAAGMPVPTMYQYLRSKDDLLTMVFDTYLAEIERSISMAAAQGRTATQKLAAAIRANLTSFDKYHKQIRLMSRETQALNPEARERVKRHLTSYIRLFSNIITEGIEKDEFRKVDPELMANFIAMLCEVWPLRFWSVGRFGLAAIQDAILAFVADGLRKPIGKMS